MPDQDVAQGSYIALPLTLLLLLAAYNHEKVQFDSLAASPALPCWSHMSAAPVVLQVIPLLLQVASRIQGVRTMAQASGDGAALEDAKRQAKRQKARRT